MGFVDDGPSPFLAGHITNDGVPTDLRGNRLGPFGDDVGNRDPGPGLRQHERSSSPYAEPATHHKGWLILQAQQICHLPLLVE